MPARTSSVQLDHLYTELNGIRRDMRGISPKTSTYQKLQKRLDDLSLRISNIKEASRKSTP